MHVCVPTIFKYTNNLSASRDHEIAALSELGNKHSGEVNSLVIEVRAFNGQRYRRMLTMQHRIPPLINATFPSEQQAAAAAV
ncbi:hypothetical protein ALC56_02229 [Trachymyrmex septentrionalis]|uniref:Uncharacterized protein n=1 Tax=Trachymyrmex septentrionalis TaxID=34720 RepID=A0A195FS66_9HYME|nr:hypothetical protein ALC56_02229 [Trachymyrmex septentrionalis]